MSRASRATKASKRPFSLTPAQFRYRWVKALESAKYRQGRLVLHKIIKQEDGNEIHEYCCLGVACDLYKRYGGRLAATKGEREDGQYEVAYGPIGQEETAALPRVVQDALGLEGCSGQIDRGRSLATLNDNGTSFAEIAAVIRSKPEGLIATTKIQA